MVLEVLLGGGHVVMEVNKVADEVANMMVQMEVDKVAEMVTLIKIVWFFDVIDVIVIEGYKCCWQKRVALFLRLTRS